MAEKRAMRVHEAAEALGISETVTWALIASGELRSFRIGKARLVTPEAVRELVERKEAEAKSA